MKRLVMLAFVALATVACTPRPQARLVAVSGADIKGYTTTVTVLVEIENPTRGVLMLSGFDYEVHAKGWFTARGSYALSRFLAPGDVAYIEVPLPVKNLDMALGATEAALEGVRFEMRGRIRALQASGEIGWDVQQDGALEPIVKVREHDHRSRHPAKGQIRVRVGVGS